jgi:ATP-dependent DNA ligase
MLAIKPPLAPMEARLADTIPSGDVWQYEPKWDGFRCLAFREGAKIYLQSKSGQPLARYFPDMVESLMTIAARKFVLDGEIMIPVGGRSSFDDLLMRIHPAASRVRKLAVEHPAIFVVFDLLLDSRGHSLLRHPLNDRRLRLEKFAKKYLRGHDQVRLSPATKSIAVARRWLRSSGASLDGVIAKRRDATYLSGSRDGMEKVKRQRTADCVVGGFRYAEGKRVLGSLLLGLYDKAGQLNHVGFTSAFSAPERKQLIKRFEAIVEPPGFTGRAPGGPSRWSTGRSSKWQPVKPKIVVEVQYDQITANRFRHGACFNRFRPDKAPKQCTFEQLASKRGIGLKQLLRKQSVARSR